MPVKSYLAYPLKGKKDILGKELQSIPGCTIVPATNEDLIVLVTDTATEKQEETISSRINKLKSLSHITLVSGFEDKN